MDIDEVLDTAARLFAAEGLGGPGMDEIARAAGCSRATLYRHFANRRALQVAFAHREARSIVTAVAGRLVGVEEDHLVVEAVLGVLDEIRARPHLATWYADDGTPVLAEILRDSPVIESLAGTFMSPGADADPDLVQWILRLILSFLREPGADETEERRLLDRFLPDRAFSRAG